MTRTSLLFESEESRTLAPKAMVLPSGDHTAGPAVWSPDGKTIAFGASVRASSDSNKSDVRVITRAVYRGDDEGYFDPSEHAHIWTVPVVSGDTPQKARQVTTGEFDEGNPQWSADGQRIYFVSQRVVEDYYLAPDQDLFSVPAAGGKMDTVVDIDGPVTSPTLAQAGASWAFRGF